MAGFALAMRSWRFVGVADRVDAADSLREIESLVPFVAIVMKSIRQAGQASSTSVDRKPSARSRVRKNMDRRQDDAPVHTL